MQATLSSSPLPLCRKMVDVFAINLARGMLLLALSRVVLKRPLFIVSFTLLLWKLVVLLLMGRMDAFAAEPVGRAVGWGGGPLLTAGDRDPFPERSNIVEVAAACSMYGANAMLWRASTAGSLLGTDSPLWRRCLRA